MTGTFVLASERRDLTPARLAGHRPSTEAEAAAVREHSRRGFDWLLRRRLDGG
jgi:hypothetical protein